VQWCVVDSGMCVCVPCSAWGVGNSWPAFPRLQKAGTSISTADACGTTPPAGVLAPDEAFSLGLEGMRCCLGIMFWLVLQAFARVGQGRAGRVGGGRPC